MSWRRKRESATQRAARYTEDESLFSPLRTRTKKLKPFPMSPKKMMTGSRILLQLKRNSAKDSSHVDSLLCATASVAFMTSETLADVTASSGDVMALCKLKTSFCVVTKALL